MMIWHIFKKDWRLMWPYAAGLAALHFASMAALLRIGRFRAAPLNWIQAGSLTALEADHTANALINVFPILSYLASCLLLVAIVQQDAIPGVRQDWLVRPIRRRDLFLASSWECCSWFSYQFSPLIYRARCSMAFRYDSPWMPRSADLCGSGLACSWGYSHSHL